MPDVPDIFYLLIIIFNLIILSFFGLCVGGGGKYMLGRVARNVHVGVLPSPHWASETSQNIEMFAYSKFSWAARRRDLAEMHHPMIILSKFLFSIPTIGSRFIQASMSKIQGLFNDFYKPLQQISRTLS